MLYVSCALHLRTLHINLTISFSIASVNLGDSFIILNYVNYKSRKRISYANSTVRALIRCSDNNGVLWNKHWLKYY